MKMIGLFLLCATSVNRPSGLGRTENAGVGGDVVGGTSGAGPASQVERPGGSNPIDADVLIGEGERRSDRFGVRRAPA